MIISDKHKYLFIQLEKTASTAIASELIANYAGRPILWKHATLSDFLKHATPQQQKYFKFSGVRNPLDIAVSWYHIRKQRIPKDPVSKKQTSFIKGNPSFPRFFKKFYPNNHYQDWKTRDFNKLNFIYRYEDIQSDFSHILKKLDIKQKRSLPTINKTLVKTEPYLTHYTKEIQGQAQMTFSSFFKRFNYSFPSSWKPPTIKEKLNLLNRSKRAIHLITKNKLMLAHYNKMPKERI
tara:strand:+ start:2278 stop:2985 length:708 start_codon:yes stop_codon:yes gene_type:complete